MCWENSKLFYKQISKYKQKKSNHKIRKQKQNQKAAINNKRETIHQCTTVFNYPCFQQYDWVEQTKTTTISATNNWQTNTYTYVCTCIRNAEFTYLFVNLIKKWNKHNSKSKKKNEYKTKKNPYLIKEEKTNRYENAKTNKNKS